MLCDYMYKYLFDTCDVVTEAPPFYNDLDTQLFEVKASLVLQKIYKPYELSKIMHVKLNFK